MADLVFPLRSLGSTLVSSVFTCALFAAANWDFQLDLMGNPRSPGLLSCLLHGCAMPMIALRESLLNAACVWRVKRSLRNFSGLAEWPNHRSIAIVTLCPLYIQVPRALIPEAKANGLMLTSWHDIQKLEYPLELTPRQALDPLAPVEDSTQCIYTKVPTEAVLLNLQARVALLASRLLVRNDNAELRRLRSRSRFHTVVTILQAGGYMVCVMQRMAQHVAISPVEVIVFFFSLHVLLQFIVERYACRDFQRPILVRLTEQQLSSLRDSFTIHRPDLAPCPKAWMEAVSCMALLIFTIPSAYYFFRYQPAPLLSSVAMVLFFLALVYTPLVSVIGLKLAELAYVEKIIRCTMCLVTLVSRQVILGCSIILAVVATILNWHAFNKATLNAIAWIFPHV